MRILYAGQLFHGSTAAHRMEALRSLGHDVDAVDTTIPPLPPVRRLLFRVLFRLGRPPDVSGANEALLAKTRERAHDVLWIDKGRSIERKTLVEIKRRDPGCLFIFYSPDDMTFPGYATRAYLAGAPLYDLHVTTKSYNIDGLKKQGAKRVLLVNNAYDAATHRPVEMDAEDRARWGAEVGFVGRFEPDRGEKVLAVARAGFPVRVVGPRWSRLGERHPNLTVQDAQVVGDDYARAICGARVNLCLLSRIVPDQQTTRSMEIPACGGFMLGERTDEHRALFEEGTEAEFFGTDEELVRKVSYYLLHEEERRKVAAAGRARCLKSGYSNAETMARILDAVSGTASS